MARPEPLASTPAPEKAAFFENIILVEYILVTSI